MVSQRKELTKSAVLLPGMLDDIMCPLFKGDDILDESMCRGGQTDLMRVIIHLNDHHKWSREQIADWLDDQAEVGKVNIDFEDDIFKDYGGNNEYTD